MAVERCRQTLGVVERTLDGVATERDREHARGCAACTRALGRSSAFERELVGAVRSLAVETMPARLLQASTLRESTASPATGIRSAVRFIAIGAAAVLVVVGGSLLVRPDGGPGASPPASPPAVIRSEEAMVAAMADLGFSCRVSIVGPDASPPIEGPLCEPTVPRSGVLIFGAMERDPSGAIDRVSAKGKAEGVAGLAGRTRVEETLAEIAGIAFPSATDADAAEAWVRSVTPVAAEFVREETTIGGLALRFEGTATDGYRLYVEAAPG